MKLMEVPKNIEHKDGSLVAVYDIEEKINEILLCLSIIQSVLRIKIPEVKQ